MNFDAARENFLGREETASALRLKNRSARARESDRTWGCSGFGVDLRARSAKAHSMLGLFYVANAGGPRVFASRPYPCRSSNRVSS
jgi:hypothetical protein